MRKIDPKSLSPTPWKNGGGMTTCLLTIPAGADLDSFDARISTARVDKDGPFSAFPGIDRTLVVTKGAGMTLKLGDDFEVGVDGESPPFSFVGDSTCDAKLKDGPVTDFNVMTRRASFRHRIARLMLDGDRTLTPAGGLSLLVPLDRGITAETDDATLEVGPDEVLVVDPSDPAVQVRVGDPVRVLLIDVWRR